MSDQPQFRKSSLAFEALGPDFSVPVDLAAFPDLRLRFRNDRAASQIGLTGLSDQQWVQSFGAFDGLPGAAQGATMSGPRAMRYHGHQFQVYNPDIGDGRGALIAQVYDQQDRLLDLASKGSGQTPFSRSGDGRLTLKGGVREVLAAEMLEALGVKTSRALSLIETGEKLQRHDEPSPTRAAVMVRMSHSHVRFGCFQCHSFEQAHDRVEGLLDHVVDQYFPQLAGLPRLERIQGFLRQVCQNSAELVASWMLAGFVHGVLNTDNMVVTGESFDYGPYRFLPHFDPGLTAAYFDHSGLYAFGRQPDAVAWNLSRLAGCFLPLVDDKQQLELALSEFGPAFQRALRAAFWRRLRLLPDGLDQSQQDQKIAAVFQVLKSSQSSFEAFFQIVGLARDAGKLDPAVQDQALDLLALPHLGEPLDLPLTTLIYDEIETLWRPIAEADDWRLFDAKIVDIRKLGTAFRP